VGPTIASVTHYTDDPAGPLNSLNLQSRRSILVERTPVALSLEQAKVEVRNKAMISTACLPHRRQYDCTREDVQYLAGHADPRTTRLYDRRRRKVTRNFVERISINIGLE
jgi:hypothetical protein